MSFFVANITVDCHNAATLAEFWSALLERPADPNSNESIASIEADTETGPALTFLKVPDKNPGKNTIHIDLMADDMAYHVKRAVELGATHVADYDEYGVKWTTLKDPEGNVFDIVAAA
ncbi:VOC family protein [Nocardia tengchongensis]|uniref:VOC family protein n=1 Tax=Nocardia tengchongensis TaxID=2055889 RepID=UPI0036863B2F